MSREDSVTKITHEIDMDDEGSETDPGKIPVLRAIRLKCLDCSADARKEVELCPVANCPLHPFRFGKNPFRRKRNIDPEKQREILEKAWAAKMKKKTAREAA